MKLSSASAPSNESGRRAAPPFAFRGRPGRPVVVPRRTPTQQRSVATVEALLDATIQVLGAVGAARCTTTRVAAAAGVSVGTLYQYFPNRDALLYACKGRYLEQLFGPLEVAMREAAALPPRRGVQHVVRVLLSTKQALAPMSAALAGVMMEVGDRAQVRRTQRRARAGLAALRDRWGGAPDDALGPLVAAAAVDGVLATVAEEQRRALSDPALEARLVTIVCAALGVGARRGPPTRRVAARTGGRA